MFQIRKHRVAQPDFFERTRSACKLLMIEIAGLGDVIHSLPAMGAARQAYPDAELHCLVRAPHAELLERLPWIDAVHRYQRGAWRALPESIALIRHLRAERFDVSIDLIGSDHGSVVAAAIAARHRLVRRPGNVRRRYLWSRVATDVVEHPKREPMYVQRWKALAQAGFVTSDSVPEFAAFPAGHTTETIVTAIARKGRPYVHVSPFTRRPDKEMALPQLSELLQQLHARLPMHSIVLTCSPSARECKAMDHLLTLLPFRPQVFRGTLSLCQLVNIIRGSALHVGGDTGSMHLACVLNTPSVTWFRHHAQIVQWAPTGWSHVTVSIPEAPPEPVLDRIVQHAMELIGAGNATHECVAPAGSLRPRRITAG